MFKTFKQYAVLKESANRSISHLLSLAHSDRMMVVITSFRQGRDQPPPRSLADLQRDIRSQMGFEIIPNPACEVDPSASPEIVGPNPIASLPHTGKMGFTKSIGGFEETGKDANGQDTKYNVCEDSVVVSHQRGGEPSDEEIIDFFAKLCRKYRQDGFLFKSPSSPDIQMVSSTGEAFSLGQMKPANVIDLYFTHLRKGPNYTERRIKAS